MSFPPIQTNWDLQQLWSLEFFIPPFFKMVQLVPPTAKNTQIKSNTWRSTKLQSQHTLAPNLILKHPTKYQLIRHWSEKQRNRNGELVMEYAS